MLIVLIHLIPSVLSISDTDCPMCEFRWLYFCYFAVWSVARKTLPAIISIPHSPNNVQSQVDAKEPCHKVSKYRSTIDQTSYEILAQCTCKWHQKGLQKAKKYGETFSLVPNHQRCMGPYWLLQFCFSLLQDLHPWVKTQGLTLGVALYLLSAKTHWVLCPAYSFMCTH